MEGLLILLVLLILAVGGILVGLWITGASLALPVGSIDDMLDEHRSEKGRL
jgi:hypothetical protein